MKTKEKRSHSVSKNNLEPSNGKDVELDERVKTRGLHSVIQLVLSDDYLPTPLVADTMIIGMTYSIGIEEVMLVKDDKMGIVLVDTEGVMLTT